MIVDAADARVLAVRSSLLRLAINGDIFSGHNMSRGKLFLRENVTENCFYLLRYLCAHLYWVSSFRSCSPGIGSGSHMEGLLPVV